MSCGQILTFPDKHHLAAILLEFNFSLPAGVTISSIKSPVVEVLAGIDAAPSAVLGGAAAASPDGKAVHLPMIGGLPGATYLFTISIVPTGNPTAEIVLQAYITVT